MVHKMLTTNWDSFIKPYLAVTSQQKCTLSFLSINGCLSLFFNIISVMLYHQCTYLCSPIVFLLPAHPTQYSLQATGCFTTQPSTKELCESSEPLLLSSTHAKKLSDPGIESATSCSKSA